MTGWVKRWFVLSWGCGIVLFAIGIFFQNRDGKPSGSMPWGPLFAFACVSTMIAMLVARRRDAGLFRRAPRRIMHDALVASDEPVLIRPHGRVWLFCWIGVFTLVAGYFVVHSVVSGRVGGLLVVIFVLVCNLIFFSGTRNSITILQDRLIVHNWPWHRDVPFSDIAELVRHRNGRPEALLSSGERVRLRAIDDATRYSSTSGIATIQQHLDKAHQRAGISRPLPHGHVRHPEQKAPPEQ
jgi:hypothetical protein